MFSLTGIEHRYGADVVLRVEAWRAAPGEHWLLAGPSGSGKSTLLHVLAGLTLPSAGRAIVAGTDLATLAGHARDRWRGRSVGLVPQRLHLIGALTVRDNLRAAQYLADLPDDPARVRELLEAVQVADLAHRYPRQLSQGQAQRVAIARAVVNRPALVLADEPTANLDDAHAAAALELLRAQAVAVNAVLVVASHDARVRPLLPHTFALPARRREEAARAEKVPQ
jgi:putative ABC transport system ATP-binding protein